jgi:hypothetical protein
VVHRLRWGDPEGSGRPRSRPTSGRSVRPGKLTGPGRSGRSTSRSPCCMASVSPTWTGTGATRS